MLICNTITMEPTIFCHTTALHALRSSRTWRGRIPWPPLFSERQRDVLRAANGHRDRIDVPWLEGLGIIPKREGDAPGPMHLLVANRSVHAKRPGIRTHQCSIDLPEGSLLEVATDCYVCSPALTLVQLAATADQTETCLALLHPFGIKEICRAGTIALEKGSGVTAPSQKK